MIAGKGWCLAALGMRQDTGKEAAEQSGHPPRATGCIWRAPSSPSEHGLRKHPWYGLALTK